MEQRKYSLTADELCLDLLTLMDGIFEATVKKQADAIELLFTNGQRFRIGIEEITEG